MASNQELQAQLKDAQAENDALRQELDKLKAINATAVQLGSPDSELGKLTEELKVLKKDLIVQKGELQVALDIAKTNAGLNVPPPPPTDPKSIIRVPLPKNRDGTEQSPHPNAVLKQYRVTLKDCASKIVELWEMPGSSFASHGLAIAAFNKYMGVRSSDYAHEVTEVTGPETINPIPVISGQFSTATINPIDVMTGAVADPAISRVQKMAAELAGVQ